MQVQAVKCGDHWILPDLPGFENIKRDVITVNVDLAGDAWSTFEYKELRGIAIMERYYEKRGREIAPSCNRDELKNNFRKKFNIDSTSIADFLSGI